MSTKSNILEYFKSGWMFLIPYLVLYFIAWIFKIDVNLILTLYEQLHIIHFFGYLFSIYFIFDWKDFKDIIFWCTLTLLFFIPGAYLEYPSDALEHVRRIFQWNHHNLIGEGDSNYKFSYFFTYSIVKYFDPINQKIALDLYYVFVSLLLCLHFYRLSIQVIECKDWSKIAVFILILSFGISSFNFIRYFALSSSLFCVLGYIIFVSCSIDKTRNKDVEFCMELLGVYSAYQIILKEFYS